jgi:hypothetical protein
MLQRLGNRRLLPFPTFVFDGFDVLVKLLARNAVEFQAGGHDLVTDGLVGGEVVLEVEEAGGVVKVVFEELEVLVRETGRF